MKLFWLGFWMVFLPGFIVAQDTPETSVEKSVATPVNNREELQQLISQLTGSQKQELLSAYFLDKETATDFVAKVFAGTENAHQPERKEAVSGYYHSLSVKAAAYFSALLPDLKDIRIAEAWERPGATDLMKVFVLKLDIVFADGTAQGQRVNVVETDKGYRILNLED